MHNAWVTASGEKMSKSLGNSLQVMEILKRVRGIELRWYLGSAHYRSMLEFSFEALEESATAFRRIENFLYRVKEIEGEIKSEIDGETKTALDDDLAVPQVLSHISELLRAGNSALNEGKSALIEAKKIRGALSILGCDPFDPAFGESGNKKLDKAVDGLIALLLEQREAARTRKDFAAADAIRDRIASMGIIIEDTPSGPRWSVE
jgi:cysteinyl-tRNA synthetase